MEKKLIAGTMRWGSWGAQMSSQQYADTITQWLECGVNDFDLANLYGDYSCEKEFGAASIGCFLCDWDFTDSKNLGSSSRIRSRLRTSRLF